MRNPFVVTRYRIFTDLTILLMRISFGYAFVIHGKMKFHSPLHWMGPDSGFPPFLQLLALIAEFGGGLALIHGLVTRLAALGIAITMAVAVAIVAFDMGAPFIDPKGGVTYELPLFFMLIALMLVALGPGRFSLDRLLFGERRN
jgi:putative oxidoreductase